jgi:Domain of unknown function (DUF309)
VIPTAPLRVRNRLTEIILAALEKPEARRELTALVESDESPDWLEGDDLGCRPLVRARALSAQAALAARVPRPIRSRPDLLDAAATLFTAHLYFEVHELLEPSWREAEGDEREALQGLIQVAVGYQHLANGNFAGARALLEEGRRRIQGRTLDGLDLEKFGHGVGRSLDRLFQLDWETVPAFPRPRSGGAARRSARKEIS